MIQNQTCPDFRFPEVGISGHVLRQDTVLTSLTLSLHSEVHKGIPTKCLDSLAIYYYTVLHFYLIKTYP